MEEVNGHELNRAKSSIDSANQLVDHSTQVLVLFHILPRGNSDLNQNNLADPLGVLRQEHFKGVKFLGDALDIIQTIDTNHKFDTLELPAESSNTLLHLGPLESLDELVGVDSDGEGAHGHEATIPVNAVRSRGTLEDARATAEEMSSVVVGVEPNEIAVEETGKKGLSDRQDSVDFTAGEWGMEEEANLDVLFCRANHFAKHLRKEHQVVVVDPDEIAILDILDDCLGEKMVDFLVCGPRGLVERDLTGMVVKEGPEDRVCMVMVSVW